MLSQSQLFSYLWRVLYILVVVVIYFYSIVAFDVNFFHILILSQRFKDLFNIFSGFSEVKVPGGFWMRLGESHRKINDPWIHFKTKSRLFPQYDAKVRNIHSNPILSQFFFSKPKKGLKIHENNLSLENKQCT